MAWPACASCYMEAPAIVTGGGIGPSAVCAPDRMGQDSAHTVAHYRSVGGHCGRVRERSNHIVPRRQLPASCCEDTVGCSAILWLRGRCGLAGGPCWGSVLAARCL